MTHDIDLKVAQVDCDGTAKISDQYPQTCNLIHQHRDIKTSKIFNPKL